jgi:hypothetical protein
VRKVVVLLMPERMEEAMDGEDGGLYDPGLVPVIQADKRGELEILDGHTIQHVFFFFFFTNFYGCCFTTFLFFPLLQIPFCFTNSSMAAVLQKRKLVVDSAGFIDGVAFNASTECDYFTIPQVIAEVRDKKSQDFALVENFTVRTPGADAMKAVTSFSKKV